MRPMRLVAPFLPLPPQNPHHAALSDFDWIGAIRMLSHSADVACGVPVQVITDAGAELPVPCLRHVTQRRDLMLWVLEACVAYLESDDFDRDTVCLDCDQLIHRDLRPFFAPRADLGILVRPRMQHRDTWRKIINGVQFWAVAAKPRLAAFYRAALAHAERLSEDLVQWGGDTEALRALIEPVSVGLHHRHGLVVNLISEFEVSRPLTQDQIDAMARGVAPKPITAVTDFRFGRKVYMPQFYGMTVLREATACA